MNAETKSLLDQGNAAFARHEFSAAEACFIKVLREHRNYPDLYCKLGAIYHDKGRFNDAIKLFAEALKLNPNYIEARVNLLVLLNDLGHYDHAARLLSKFNGGGSSPGALNMGRLAGKHLEVGDMYFSLGLYEHARVELEHACKLRPGWSDVRMKLGVTLRRLNRLDESIRELETAIAINPKYLKARTELGMSYFQAGKTNHAVSLWKAVLAAEPENKIAQRYLALTGEAARATAAA
jgi:tetratricopeptide (TPR) repeat protein